METRFECCNNGYGLKVFAFMRLSGLPLTHEHIFDASAAPRGQLRSRFAGQWINEAVADESGR